MSKFIVKNFAINLVTIILIQTASLNLQPVCCFWLTDGISFQPIADSIGLSQAPKGELSPKAGLSIKPTDAQGNSEQQADQLKATIATNSLATSNEGDNKNNKAFEPVTWPLRATNQQSDELVQLNSSRPDAQNQSVPVCQCSPEWAHNQTSQWLARWLSGPTFANQVRSVVFMSNSTVAKKQHQWKQQQQQQQQAKQHNGNHLSAWVRAKNNNARTQTRTKWERSPGGLAATTPASIATTTTTTTKASIVYERGPKGDQGPRGERGPSGLISVKDRDALFDLVDFEQNDLAEGRPQQQSSPDAGSPAAKSRPRLAYVESEQMLVVATMTGWRPVPLAAPLRDFRKTVAKFRLNKEEDRRRLLTLNADQSLSDNSISAGVAFRVADKNEIFENNDDVDGVDQDEEEEDDDEDDEDDDDDDDDDNEDDDEDDERDDNQDDDNENLVLPPKAIKVALTAKQAANPKRRRAQLTSRSGGGQIIDNSISAPPLATKMSPLEGSAKRSTEAESGPAMKQLRLVALNEPFSGNLHGLRGANFECKRNAARANIKGAFRAFLGANYQNLNEIVRHNGAQKYPIVNLRGETLASSWHDLFKAPARMTNPLSRLYSFDGRHVASDSNWPNKLVWHGSGNRLGHRDSLHNCDGWHSDSLSKFGYASPLHPPRGLHHSSSSSSVSATNRLTQQRNPIHRRFLDQISANNSTNSMADTTTTTTTTNMPPFLDAIDKYPCRMPLIVLCMETIAQSNE